MINKKLLNVIRNVSPHWVGDGFPVRSLISYNHQPERNDPFLLLDYAGPAQFPPAEKRRGVEEHPHRGFETVTIVYSGEVSHRDSAGNQGTIGPGDVQWMTAASGVVHEEFHSDRFTKAGGLFEVIQLWVNLPSKEKMSSPKYQGIVDGQIPKVSLIDDKGTMRVIAGHFLGVQGPASTFTPINLWDLQLQAVGSVDLDIPEGHTALVIVHKGKLIANDQPLIPVELAQFDRTGDRISIKSEMDSRALILTGQPINEPIVGHGPFVMNTSEEISQAIKDYQAGRMGVLA
jgi:quercetin 2,3-dioxygenase